MIYQPKEALIQFPSLWLPGSPLPSSRGMPGYPCCCDQGCNGCESGTVPQQIEVILTGVVDNFCNECTGEGGFNDTYILDFVPSSDPTDPCEWFLVIDPPLNCGAGSMLAQISQRTIPQYSFRVFLGGGEWYSDLTTPFDCSDLSSLTMETEDAIAFSCNGIPSTMTVTAL